MKAKNIVVVGSSNTDLVIQVPRFPAPGETILGRNFMTAAGGKGANQAVAAARAGGRVALVAKVGDDAHGRASLAGFRKDGLDVRLVGRDAQTASGVALILVSGTGENCIAAANGANGRLSVDDVHRARAAIAGAGVLVVQLEVPMPTVAAAINMAHKNGVPVILNPAPARKVPAAILKKVSYLTPNESECEILTGVRFDGTEPSARRAAEALLARGVRHVVLTLGGRGAYVASEGLRTMVPGFKVRALDTTAAGDVFNGALAVALVEGKELIEAVRFGQAAAAISVTRAGAQSSAPKRGEIDRFIARDSRS